MLRLLQGHHLGGIYRGPQVRQILSIICLWRVKVKYSLSKILKVFKVIINHFFFTMLYCILCDIADKRLCKFLSCFFQGNGIYAMVDY
jgi:hypothetical protein